MPETVTITATHKQAVYDQLYPQMEALVAGEPDAVANMANVSSALKVAFPSFSWVGFYILRGEELVLGPFQGKPACVRITPGRGVCGTSFQRRETIIVPDVHAFPGHIACDAGSMSEIVIPLLDGARCYGVLDVDSYEKNSFDDTDAENLAKASALIVPHLQREFADGTTKG